MKYLQNVPVGTLEALKWTMLKRDDQTLNDIGFLFNLYQIWDGYKPQTLKSLLLK